MREKFEKQKLEEMKCDVEPVSLQYLDEYAAQDKTTEPGAADVLPDRPHNFPYSIVSKIVGDKDHGKQTEDNEDNEINYDCESTVVMVSYDRGLCFLHFFCFTLTLLR